MIEKWEYKIAGNIEKSITEKEMNVLGADGWELVCALPTYDDMSGLRAIFKRKKIS